MSTSLLAAGAVVVAYYAYSRSRRELQRRGVIETHTNVEQAPNDWTGELFLFAEALRYLYFETLARWPTADLFIGLIYLARQGLKDFPAKQVVAHGRRTNMKRLSGGEASKLKDDLHVLKRLLLYSQKLKFSRPVLLQEVWAELELKPEDFLIYQPKAAVLKPAYVLVKDEKLKSVVLAIRGTHSVKDIFTSLTGACKPHHMVSSEGVVLGHSHFGMLAGARWILRETGPTIEAALGANPGYNLRITGHSMGGGAAAMVTMIIREQYPKFGDAQCTAFACPGCMTLEIAKSCSDYVTTVVYGTDVVPTLSPAALDLLREDVAQSSWGNAFRKDVRSSNMVQAVEGRVRGIITSMSRIASSGLRGCYGDRRKSGGAEKEISNSSENEILLGSEDMEGEMEGGNGRDGDLAGTTLPGRREIPVLDFSSQGPMPLPISSTSLQNEQDSLIRQLAEVSMEIEADAIGDDSQSSTLGGNGMEASRLSGLRGRFARVSSSVGGSIQPASEWGKQTSLNIASSAGSLWSQVWSRKQRIKTEEERGNSSGLNSIALDVEQSIPVNNEDLQEALETEEVEGVFDGRSACASDQADEDQIQAQIEEGSLPQEVLWKRQLYPAGRILHVVPAFILKADHSDSIETCENGNATIENDDEGTSGEWYHPKESDFESDSEDFDENEQYVLFSDVPQEAYNRVRMSRSMVGDHFVPRYRGAIESMIDQLEKRQLGDEG